MQNIYFVPLHMSALVYFISSLLLFLRHKDGERSRLILAYIYLISVFSRVLRIVCIYIGVPSSSVVSPTMLVLAIGMITLNIIYAIEVISPGWLNFKRLLNVCSPLILIYLVYLATRLTGVEYTPYNSLIEMLPMANHFDVIFRLTLSIFIFIPIFILFFIPYTKRYNNTDRKWILRFIAIISVANLAYFVVIIHDNFITHTLYLYISAACGLYIAYQELFVRLIDKSQVEITEKNSDNVSMSVSYADYDDKGVNNVVNKGNSTDAHFLFCKLDKYMNEQRAWREPDLSMLLLSQNIGSNRTSLTKAIQCGGYGSFHDYVAHYRIREFCHVLKENRNLKVDDLFYQVGFRSRSTAFVHFKKQMNMTPAEYFKTLSNTK